MLVSKFIAIIDGTAEFVSLAAQKAALYVIAEVGLLTPGNSKIPGTRCFFNFCGSFCVPVATDSVC